MWLNLNGFFFWFVVCTIIVLAFAFAAITKNIIENSSNADGMLMHISPELKNEKLSPQRITESCRVAYNQSLMWLELFPNLNGCPLLLYLLLHAVNIHIKYRNEKHSLDIIQNQTINLKCV